MKALPRLLLATVVALLAAAPLQTFAQTARSGGAQNAQLLQQLQQLASERTALQAENARMKQELEALRKERDSLKSAQKALSDRARSSETALSRRAAESESVESELQQQKTRMQELVAKFRETAQTLKEVDAERAGSKQLLTQREQELTACVDKNAALYKLNVEVLDRLEDRGFLSRLATTEPFTKLKRVQLENLVDDYKYRAADQKVSASPSLNAAPKTP